MALIKSLLAPIRRVAHFPLFQFAVTVAVILWLQAADSHSVFGEIFSALDWLVDFSVKRFAALFEVKSFTRSWLTVGFMIVYVYLAGWMILFLAKVVIRAAVELVARMNAFGLRNAIARDRGIAAYRAWLPLERIRPTHCRFATGVHAVPHPNLAGQGGKNASCGRLSKCRLDVQRSRDYFVRDPILRPLLRYSR